MPCVCAPNSEWNVVVPAAAKGSGHGVRLQLAAARLEAARLTAAAGALAVAGAEELHRVGDDLDRLALRAVLALPLAPLEPAVDRDRAALRQIVRAVLALRAPHLHGEVVRLLDP